MITLTENSEEIIGIIEYIKENLINILMIK